MYNDSDRWVPSVLSILSRNDVQYIKFILKNVQKQVQGQQSPVAQW